MTDMIAFTDPASGLRDYRVSAVGTPLSPRGPSGWVVLVCLAFLIGLALGTQVHAAEDPCVRLQLRPQFLLQRGDVDVQARVAHHADHRALVVSWDSDTGAGGSRSFALDGEHDRALFSWVNHEQPAGHYIFDAVVFDAGGHPIGHDRRQIAPEDSQ